MYLWTLTPLHVILFFSVCGLLIDRRERTITAALSPFRTIFFWSKRERLLTHTWWWWHFYWIFASTTISSKETCALCFTSSFYYCIRVFKKKIAGGKRNSYKSGRARLFKKLWSQRAIHNKHIETWNGCAGNVKTERVEFLPLPPICIVWYVE